MNETELKLDLGARDGGRDGARDGDTGVDKENHIIQDHIDAFWEANSESESESSLDDHAFSSAGGK